MLAPTASGWHPHAGGDPRVHPDGRDLAGGSWRTVPPGCPYLVYLRHPTTGGVYASWGSLARDRRRARSAVGFLGPKVYEALNGVPFPAGVQTAENLAAKASRRRRGRPRTCPMLVDRPWRPRRRPDPAAPRPSAPASRAGTCPPGSPSEVTRRPEPRRRSRPAALTARTCTLRLRGTDEGERDSHDARRAARLDGQPCVLVGQDRARQSPTSSRWGLARCVRPGGHAPRRRRWACRSSPSSTPAAPSRPQRCRGGRHRGRDRPARSRPLDDHDACPTASVVLGQGCGGQALAAAGAPRR